METKIRENRIVSDLIIPPGEYLGDMLRARRISQINLAYRAGLSRKHINGIINGKEMISPAVALKLERVLGAPASYWINLSRNFELDTCRAQEEKELASKVERLKKFPILEMKKFGLIKRDAEKTEQVQQLLSFFHVANFSVLDDQIKNYYVVHFRKGAGKRVSREALAVWIRAGQNEALAASASKFNAEKLRSAVVELRHLTTDLSAFYKKAKGLLSDAGIVLTSVRHMGGTYANGASYWIKGQTVPVVQLSLRNKWCDIILFTLFHELGHILHHSKKKIRIFGSDDNPAIEKEADDFARNTIIPPSSYAGFLKKNRAITIAAVKSFAKQVGIHPGLIIGRLMREGKLEYSNYRFAALRPQFERGGK